MILLLLAFILAAACASNGAVVSIPQSAAFDVLLRSAQAFSERTPDLSYLNNQTARAVRRAEAWSATHPGLQASIDAAIASTAGKTHYFWSGRISPGLSEDDGVKIPAMKIAAAKGGTTLELTLQHVNMPVFSGVVDPDAGEIWQYASDEYAARAKGDVYVVLGEMLRGGNVWEVYEYPRLKKSSVVKRIFQIKVHRTSTELPHQIFPALKGCDGVIFVEKTVTCPAGSKLYYGSTTEPMVTAKTTTADTKVKTSTTGRASGVVPECTEIITSEFISELLTDSGACDAANDKGNNGVVMKQVKQLISSSQNRNYIQTRGLLKTKQQVIGATLLLGSLEKKVIDSLMSIDYYEKTAASTRAMTTKIDSIVKSATGVSPGLTAAWAKKTATQPATKAKLLAYLQEQIAAKQKQAKETQNRNAQCGSTASKSSTTGKTKTGRALVVDAGKMGRGVFSSAFFTPMPHSSLEGRLQKAAKSGPHAPPAPSCPLKSAPQKKVVPRSKTKTKAAPAKAPRTPKKRPAARKPNPKKQRVTRPASRPRRTPGKAAPRRRTTPKKKPKVVPRPARKPKGKARARRRR